MERVVKPLLLRSNAAHQLPFSNTCFYDDLQCKRSLDAALKGHCFYILRTLAQPLFQARNLWEKETALRVQSPTSWMRLSSPPGEASELRLQVGSQRLAVPSGSAICWFTVPGLF